MLMVVSRCCGGLVNPLCVLHKLLSLVYNDFVFQKVASYQSLYCLASPNPPWGRFFFVENVIFQEFRGRRSASKSRGSILSGCLRLIFFRSKPKLAISN